MDSRENTGKVNKHNEVGHTGDIMSDFYSYWCILKRRWLPALAVFGFVFALSAIYAFTRVPIYRAQGQLLFKQEETTSSLTGLGSAAQKGDSESGGWLDADRILDTEIRVLLSDPILQRTIDVLKRNHVQGIPSNSQEFQQSIAIKKATGTNVLEVSYESKDPKLAALVVNQLMSAYIDNNLLTTRSTAIAARQFITAQLPKVKENVSRADTALRRFEEEYKITDLDATKSTLATNIGRIQSQIDSDEAQLADLNSQSVAIQKKLGMNPQKAIAVSSLSQSSAVQGLILDLQDIQRKLADARSLYQESHPVIVQLKDKESQLKTLLQEQIAQVLHSEKTVPNGNLQIGKISEDITANLISELIKGELTRIGLLKQEDILAKQKAFYLKQAAILPRLVQQRQELQRELLVAQTTYEALLKSLQEFSIQENQTIGNVRVIESAPVPVRPISPHKTLIIAIGSLGGILIAGTLIYFLEARDKRIKTVREARQLFEYTLLGTIPIFKSKRTVDSQILAGRGVQLPVVEKPRSTISESYRRLHANLKFLNSGKVLKVIAVMSSVPKEGKSTTCANLAASMAQLGKRVLIVDADMHYPVQHEFWNISNLEGLSNIITEQASPQGNYFHKVMENLDVITTGALPSNPLILIDSRRMAIFLEECSNNYNYVLIDTPPLACAAEAVHLGRIADGVVIVTRPGVADSTSSRLAKEYLEQSDQNVLGLIVNGVLPENEPHSSLLRHYNK